MSLSFKVQTKDRDQQRLKHQISDIVGIEVYSMTKFAPSIANHWHAIETKSEGFKIDREIYRKITILV